MIFLNRVKKRKINKSKKSIYVRLREIAGKDEMSGGNNKINKEIM